LHLKCITHIKYIYQVFLMNPSTNLITTLREEQHYNRALAENLFKDN
jgi:hypothetical protein